MRLPMILRGSSEPSEDLPCVLPLESRCTESVLHVVPGHGPAERHLLLQYQPGSQRRRASATHRYLEEAEKPFDCLSMRRMILDF